MSGEAGMPGKPERDKPELEDRDWELDDHDWSDKAWMSVTDADLFEALLRRKAQEGGPLEIVEWGSGKSTFYYTGVLKDTGVPFRWLSLEYDREYFTEDIEPRLDDLPGASVHLVTDAGARDLILPSGPPQGQAVEFVVFDKGRLKPMLRSGKEDRKVDMDAYVDFPAQHGRRYDVALVDGRKRRRCVLTAADLLAERGVAVLHDAWRPYYHCAFEAYPDESRVGDILWMGTQSGPDYFDRLMKDLT